MTTVEFSHTQDGHPIVPPGYTVACSGCGAKVCAVMCVTANGPQHVLPVDPDGRCVDCLAYGIDRTRCTLCHGHGVRDAGAWLGQAAQPVACPRCGLIAGELPMPADLHRELEPTGRVLR